LIVTAILFGLLVLVIHNRFEKKLAEQAITESKDNDL
jgi:hypothetical protein